MSDMTFGEWLLVFLSNHPDIEIRFNYFSYPNTIKISMVSYNWQPAHCVKHVIDRNSHDSTLFDSILIETVKHMYEQLYKFGGTDGTGD